MAMNRFDTAEKMLRGCWNLLYRATRSGRQAFRTPVIGTLDAARRQAALRTVILRQAFPQDRELAFYSDSRSEKIAQLRASPRVSCHFYDAKRQLQVRARGSAIIHIGDEQAREHWRDISLEGRKNYASVDPPATPAGEATRGLPEFWRDDMPLERTEYAFDRFAVVRITVDEMDCLLLHPEGHQRSIFQWEPAAGEWRGGWVVA